VRRHLFRTRALSGSASTAAEATELAGPPPPATAEQAHDDSAHGPRALEAQQLERRGVSTKAFVKTLVCIVCLLFLLLDAYTFQEED